MEKIWEAMIPFHPLLARDLADQTQIAGSLPKEAASPDSETVARMAKSRLTKRRHRIKTKLRPHL